MAIDWSLQIFGAAGDLHVVLLSAAAFATVLMVALKLDGRFTDSWWTVFAPLIAATTTSLYICMVTVVRLRHDSSSRHSRGLSLLVMLPFVFVLLLLLAIVLLARLLEDQDISPAAACVPLYMIFFVALTFPV